MPNASTFGPSKADQPDHAGGETPPAPAPYVERALAGRARLNVKQAAHILGIHPATLRVEVQRGRIRQVGSGKGALISADEILSYMARWESGAFTKEVTYKAIDSNNVAPGHRRDHRQPKTVGVSEPPHRGVGTPAPRMQARGLL